MHSNDHHKKAELALKHAIDMGAEQASVRFSNGQGFDLKYLIPRYSLALKRFSPLCSGLGM